MKTSLAVKILAIAAVIMMATTSLSCICTVNEYCDAVASDYTDSLPSTFNLDIDKGYAQKFPVRHQGQIGTCWAHGTSAAIESSLYLSDETFEGRISPLALATRIYDRLYYANEVPDKVPGEDRIYVIENYPTKIDCGANYYDTILGMASGRIAIIPEESMSYTLASLALQYNDTELENLSSVYTVKDIDILDVLRDKDTIKSTLTQGYVGVFEYNTSDYNVYEEGLMESRDYIPYYEHRLNDINHTVALIGWDDNYSKENFKEGTLPENDGAWIVRNSWGTTDKFSGYTYISYESIIGKVFFIKQIEKTVTEDGLLRTYCYDFGSSIREDIVLNTSASMANIFTSSQMKNDEYLEGASFTTFCDSCWATGEEYTVSVYALQDDFKSPTDGELLTVKSGKVTVAGIEYVEFDEPVALSKGLTFSVVVDLFNPDGSIVIPVDTDYADNTSVFYTAANPGESWTYINGEWTDISADGSSNIRIKAYTRTGFDDRGQVISLNMDKNEYICYDSISDALKSGETEISLLSDIVLTEQTVIKGSESVNIILNGNTVTYSGKGAAFVSELKSETTAPAELIVTNGKIVAAETAFEGTGLSLMFMTIDACKGKDAVRASDSLDLIYTYIKNGNVTVRPSSGSDDSKIIADISDTLDIGPCFDSTVNIEGGCYGKTIFDHDAVATVKYGSFNNSIEYNNAPGVNIILGLELGKDPSVIADMVNNRHGDDVIVEGDTSDGYYFDLTAIATSDYGYHYNYISDALNEKSDGDYIIPAYKDVYQRHSLTVKYDLTIGGNKTIDLNGQTLFIKNTVIIPDGLSLTVFNGTIISDTAVFKVLSGGSLTIGKTGYTTEVILNGQLNISVGSVVETKGDATVQWIYTDHLNNKYILSASSITTDTENNKITLNGAGRIVDAKFKTIAQCTDYSYVYGKEESAAYTGYMETGKFKFKDYAFEELQSVYIQPDGASVKIETVNGTAYARYSFNGIIGTSKYSIELKSVTTYSMNLIEIIIYGLKPFIDVDSGHLDNVSEAVNLISEYIDKDKPTKVTLSYFVSYEHYKDFDIPYKMFTDDAIDLAVKNGYVISLQSDDITISVDPKDIKTKEFSILIKRNSNEFMNAQQLAAAGNIKGYRIGCTDEIRTDISFLVSLKTINAYRDPAVYRINYDGTSDEMYTEFKNGTAAFRAEEAGVYIITERGSFVTAEKAPAARTDLSYNGSVQELIIPASGVGFGVAEYSMDGEVWSKEIPTAKDAGNYHVYYRYTATDDTHIGSTSYELDVEIQPGLDENTTTAIYTVVCVIVAICACIVAATVIRRR